MRTTEKAFYLTVLIGIACPLGCGLGRMHAPGSQPSRVSAVAAAPRANDINVHVPPPAGTLSVEAARKLVAESPTSAVARYQLGLALYKAGRYTDAVSAITPVAARLPDSPKVSYWLAMSYVGVPDAKHAMSAFRHILTMRNASDNYKAASHASIAYLYYDSGDMRNAKRECDDALRLDANNAHALEIKRFLQSE